MRSRCRSRPRPRASRCNRRGARRPRPKDEHAAAHPGGGVFVSVNDVRCAFGIEPGQPILHRLQLLGRVADPMLDLAHHAQRIAGAVGRGNVAREFLVGEIGVVLELTRRLDDVDAPRPLAFRQLRAPGRRLQRRAEIDVLQPALDEIAAKAGRDEVTDGEVGLGAVVEGGAGGTSRAYMRNYS